MTREPGAGAHGYRELPPPAWLAEDLTCVWYDARAKASTQSRSQLVLPDGCIDIVWVPGRELVVAGPATLPVGTEVPPGVTVIGARFAPGHAPTYLDVPADALRNASVALHEVWADDAERLLQELQATCSPLDGLQVLETALIRRTNRTADRLVGSAVSELRRDPNRSIAELSDGVGLSERHLLRRFTAAVGYGPRVFGRVMRLRRFLTLISRHQQADRELTHLALEAGFADHAHLVHECADLAGMTPSELRLRWID